MSGGGLGSGLSSAADAEALLGLPAGTGSSSGGGGSTVDYNRLAQLLGNAGTAASKLQQNDASYDKRGGEGPGPYQGATQGLSNLLATLIQMHRAAMLTVPTQPVGQQRVSLLG